MNCPYSWIKCEQVGSAFLHQFPIVIQLSFCLKTAVLLPLLISILCAISRASKYFLLVSMVQDCGKTRHCLGQ